MRSTSRHFRPNIEQFSGHEIKFMNSLLLSRVSDPDPDPDPDPVGSGDFAWIRIRFLKGLSGIADLMPGGGRGQSFHFTRPPSMFNPPYFDPYFPNLASFFVYMTWFDLPS